MHTGQFSWYLQLQMSFDGYLKTILSKFGDNSLQFTKDKSIEELVLAVGSASIIISDETKNYSDPFLDAILYDIDKMVANHDNMCINDISKNTKYDGIHNDLIISHSNLPRTKKINRLNRKGGRINQTRNKMKKKQCMEILPNLTFNLNNNAPYSKELGLRLRLQGTLNSIRQLQKQNRNLLHELNTAKDEITFYHKKIKNLSPQSHQEEEVKHETNVFYQNIVDDFSNKLKNSLDFRYKLEEQLLEEKKKCRRSKETIVYTQQLYRDCKTKLDNIQVNFDNLLFKEESHKKKIQRRNKEYKQLIEENETLKQENKRKQLIIDEITHSEEIKSDEFIFGNL
jgi:hypothetical protein